MSKQRPQQQNRLQRPAHAQILEIVEPLDMFTHESINLKNQKEVKVLFQEWADWVFDLYHNGRKLDRRFYDFVIRHWEDKIEPTRYSTRTTCQFRPEYDGKEDGDWVMRITPYVNVTN